MKHSIKAISGGWEFTQTGGGRGTEDGEWLPVSQFPTTIHVELLKLGKIPDPFVGLNDWKVQWIGETNWAFRNTFEVSEEELAASNVDLIFEGIDTFALIELNWYKILETRNQFLSYACPVKQYLRPGKNRMLISFESTFLKGKDIESKGGNSAVWNGDASRVHVRKAQYTYGWDWGPTLMTVGPWKPINLHAYDNRIIDLDVRGKVSETLDVYVTIDLTLSDATPACASVVLKSLDSNKKIAESSTKIYAGHASTEFSVISGAIDLWYPVGYGKQPMYTVEIQISDPDGYVFDYRKQKISFRRAHVIQEELIGEGGLSFLFEINNIRIFCGGSNWIPPDSFLTTMSATRYKAWLQLLVDGNQNMVRVWGGGVYEAEVFYDICDELGILVWQDFMFACGQYPAGDSFLKLVREEAEQTVKMLRHHPSVVILAGNNEDYQIAEQLKLDLDYSDEDSDFRKTNFPARHIYERLLPDIVGKLSDIYYHRGSPYSGYGKPTTDQTFGDLHQWNVWHGSQEPWYNWDILAGRFVSEFGMQAFPNIRTVDYWLDGDVSERFPQSRINSNHNKAVGFERRLELYLVENFKHSFEMESYIYYTQVMQAEALASAYRLWRRNWRGKGREYTAGALVWQLNDCWPVTSWAIIDYYLRPKPAYFAIARELRSFTVGMTRKENKTFVDERTAAFYNIDIVLEIWGTNSKLLEKKATLEVTSFDLHSDWRNKWSKEVVLAANASTELYKGELPGQPSRTNASDVPKAIIVSARLFDETGAVLCRCSNWPEPFKFIKFPHSEDLGLKITQTVSPEGEFVTLSTLKPIKGLVLDVDGPDVKWSDQAIDLVPDDPQTLKVSGLGGREVKVQYLGMER